MGEKFDQKDNQISEALQLPLRVASEPYLRCFQYEV